MRDERAVKGALMADHHLGYSMPIGGVVAYDDAVSPTGVGFDIACGNMAVKTNMTVWDFGVVVGARGELNPGYGTLQRIMREIQKRVAFGLGRTNDDRVEHALFEDDAWKDISRAFGPGLIQKARAQLGTVGSGNHYVDILLDTSGYVWVANHFGSRGFGHTIASGFMAKAAGQDFQDRIPETEESVVLQASQGLGSFYVECMNLAGRYAYAGREYVIAQVLDILGTYAVETVHNHHNFAWLEDGLWVVRKGATPLTRDPAFIGGSMGDVSVIVRERQGEFKYKDGEGASDAIGSAPHGAGRVMSRTKAAGKMRKGLLCETCGFTRNSWAQTTAQNVDTGGQCPEGHGKLKKVRVRDTSTAAIDWDAVRGDLKERGIVVLGAGADEAPGVYKRLDQVLLAHPNIEILESLRPIGVVMAGPDEKDPYKD